MMRTESRMLIALMLALAPPICSAQGGGGFSNPGAPSPMSAEDRVKELKRMQDFVTKLHDLMHQIRDAPNKAERERLKAEQLWLLHTHLTPHTGAPATVQEEIKRLIQEDTDKPTDQK